MFQNPLEEQNKKLSLGFKVEQDLTEKMGKQSLLFLVTTTVLSYRISVTKYCHQIENVVFPRGFSSNLIYNIWAMFGGIMMYVVTK